MATWEEAHWDRRIDSGVPRHERQSGLYRRYLPDLVDGVSLRINSDVSRRVMSVERGIRALNGPGAEGLAGLARLLLRSEAIASSQIEGIVPSAQQVALAELGQSETVRGISDQARLVANNMTIVREATTALVEAHTLTVDHIVDLHRSLLPSEHHGLRTVQNWIGTSRWTPIGAGYVPPDPDRVPALMRDLVGYLNGAAHAPLIQAAIVHAQFETIHPFTDGNGRVGRALIHTVLARRGLTDRAVLPVSLVLATLSGQYVAGLTAFRHDASPQSGEADTAINSWISTFIDAADRAVEQSNLLADRIKELRGDWRERLSAHRIRQGMRVEPRVDSAVARLLEKLPEAPVTTARTLAQILSVSLPSALHALDELSSAGILSVKTIARGAKAYIARDVLDLVTLSERALASTQFDTQAAPPHHHAAALPSRPD